MSKLIYLAAPYSHVRRSVVMKRSHQINHMTAKLTRKGEVIFSPITHSHPLSEYGLPTNYEFWKNVDHTFLNKADELWVLKLQGWDTSKGVTDEIEYMTKLGKPIKYIPFTEEEGNGW